jgi:hypothetical protein
MSVVMAPKPASRSDAANRFATRCAVVACAGDVV